MPRPAHAWWHVSWNTYGTWLPGDPRGFRNRDHRIHSSGDYKRRPPESEHAGLHRYSKRVSDHEVVLKTASLRKEVCQALLDTIDEMEVRCMVVTVCRVHVHLVIELPIEEASFRTSMTRLKTYSSAKVEHKPQSRLWARLWRNDLIDTPEYRQTAFEYDRDKQGPYACVWTHNKGFVQET